MRSTSAHACTRTWPDMVHRAATSKESTNIIPKMAPSPCLAGTTYRGNHRTGNPLHPNARVLWAVLAHTESHLWAKLTVHSMYTTGPKQHKGHSQPLQFYSTAHPSPPRSLCLMEQCKACARNATMHDTPHSYTQIRSVAHRPAASHTGHVNPHTRRLRPEHTHRHACIPGQ